jgi:spore maturation protein SpmA/spore maturation protein SpmB
MLLNRIWISLFVISMAMACGKAFIFHDLNIFKVIVEGLFETVKGGFEMVISLTGALCLWMGMMTIGEKAGIVNILSKLVSPLFSRLFPEIPKGHPAAGAIMLNYSANMLGLDNAATPIGLKAMKFLQELNPSKDTASNAQIMFLVLNTSGLTIIPVSIIAYRSSSGSVNPTDVFMPILFATYCSTITGLILVSIKQKLNLFNPVVFTYIGGMSALIFGLLTWCIYHPQSITTVSDFVGNFVLFGTIVSFIVLGAIRKVNIYESFVEGAKGGFEIAIGILPFVIAILAAVSVFRSSGAMQALFDGIGYILTAMGVTSLAFIDALPVAFMKPFSGPGARAMMLEVFQSKGVDSFAGKLASTFQGCTDTTFYILAVYFGSVGITRIRYAAKLGLAADFVGIMASIFLAYLFYK